MQDNHSFTEKTLFAVINTLSYSHIFGYPLTKKEIYSFLISETKVHPQKVNNAIAYLQDMKIIQKEDNFYFLKEKKYLATLRKKRTLYSKQKYKIANQAARILALIPTVRLIGISGSLSMNNADYADDIDFFIITSKNSLWISRAMVLFLLELLNLRRKKNEKNASDKICVNMLLSDDALDLSQNKNIFLAHEICQMKPLLNKNYTYEKFIGRNRWVEAFLPHATNFKIPNISLFNSFVLSITSSLFIPLNYLLYKLQYNYMKLFITHEKISKETAQFHPNDKTQIVINLYKKNAAIYINFLEELWRKKERKIPLRISSKRPQFNASHLIN